MPHRLYYCWRLLATGIAFAAFSLGGFLLTVTAFPLVGWASSTAERRSRRIRWLIHKTFQLFVLSLVAGRIIDFTSRGRAGLMGNGKGRLIVANHPTLIDVVLLVSLMPQAQCIVKHSLWSHRFLGGVMRGAGYIRNDGNPETVLGQCRDAISQGLDIIIFPEGTRSVPGQSIKFQRGFANIATMAPCDIQLVTITCRPPTLAKGSPWYDIPPTRPAFQLTVDEQVDISRYLTNDPRSKIVRRLTRDLERHYSGILTNGQA